jgi:oligopeptide transport system substrate-binding protein
VAIPANVFQLHIERWHALQRTSQAYRILITLILLAQCLALGACSTVTPSPVPTPTELPSATSMPLPTPTNTLTPTPTATSTPTVLPTATYTPKPTATPEGFNNFVNVGFSVVLPASWIVEEQDANSVVISGPNMIYLYVASEQSEQPENLDDIVNAFFESWTQYTITRQGTGEIQINGQACPYADTLVESANGKQTWRSIYYFANHRGYLIQFITRPGELASRTLTVERILDSFRFFSPYTFDLPHDQLLTLLGYEPQATGLDPATTTSSMADYVGLLYSSLVRLTPQGQIVPDLAESWQVSPDGLVYTFTLRPGIKFSSGTPITAAKVAASWERACDPKTASTTARTYLGDILGVKDRLDKKAGTISGLKVIDERTLQVTLEAPVPYFLAKLTYPTAAVVNPAKVDLEPESWVFNPDSSGPYLVREHDQDKTLIFERNPYYYNPPAIPYVAYILNSGGSGISLYEDDVIDIVGVGSADWKRVNDPNDPLNAELHTGTSMCTTLLQINANLPPFDDPLVRQAFSLATDRASFIEQLSQDTNLIPAQGILPPAMPGFLADRSEQTFDAVAARNLLAKSRYAGNLPKIVLGSPGQAGYDPRYITILVDMWQKNLGIKVEVQYFDPSAFTQSALASSANILVQGWCADYPDPENFLDILFHSQSEFNIGHTNLPALDALLEKARTEPDGQKRLVLYQQAETDLLAGYQVIPLNYSQFGVLVKPRVKDYVLSPLNAPTIPLLSLEE